jgi:ArsR family transcriptional regulator
VDERDGRLRHAPRYAPEVAAAAPPCYISRVIEAIVIEASPDADAALFGAVADGTRLRILRQLARSGATCVCNIDANEDLAPNLLSYHLKVLRDAGLVTTQRRGRWIDYSLAPDALGRLHAAIPGAAAAGTLP